MPRQIADLRFVLAYALGIGTLLGIGAVIGFILSEAMR